MLDLYINHGRGKLKHRLSWSEPAGKDQGGHNECVTEMKPFWNVMKKKKKKKKKKKTPAGSLRVEAGSDNVTARSLSERFTLKMDLKLDYIWPLDSKQEEPMCRIYIQSQIKPDQPACFIPTSRHASRRVMSQPRLLASSVRSIYVEHGSCRLNVCMIMYTKPDQTWKSLNKVAPKPTENDPLRLHVYMPTLHVMLIFSISYR